MHSLANFHNDNHELRGLEDEFLETSQALFTGLRRWLLLRGPASASRRFDHESTTGSELARTRGPRSWVLVAVASLLKIKSDINFIQTKQFF